MAKKQPDKKTATVEKAEVVTITSPTGNPATDHTKTAQERLDALTKQHDEMHKAQQ